MRRPTIYKCDLTKCAFRCTVDLHGMDIASAIDVLRARIEALLKEFTGNDRVVLRVLTGQGVHTESTYNNRPNAALKYNVQEYLTRAGYECSAVAENQGLLNAYIR